MTKEEHTQTEEPGSLLDPLHLLSVLWKRKWLVLGVTALIGVAAVFLTMRQTRIYEATCTIEYDPNPTRPLGGEITDVADPVGSFWMTQEFYQTQNRILSSRAIAERVVRSLGLHEDDDFIQPGASVETTARLLQSKVDVQQVDNTRLVEIKVQDHGPERAQLIANSIAREYVDKGLEERMSATVGALEWLSTQLDGLREELDESETELHEFKLKNNILSVSMEDRQNMVTQTLGAFTSQLAEIRGERIRLSARVDELRRANRDDPRQVHATEIAQDPAATALRAELEARITERDALTTRYGANHPDVRALNARVDRLENQLRNAIEGILDSAAGDLAQARHIEGALEAEVESVNQVGLELNRMQMEYSRLSRETTSKSKLFDLLLKRTAETNLTRLQNVSHVRIVDRALTPTIPVRPRVAINILAGILLGLLLGFAIALILERLDQTIRHVEQAENMGMTVIGVIPTINEERSRSKDSKKKKKSSTTPAPQVEDRDLIADRHPMSVTAESCRTVRTNLTFVGAEEPINALVVMSANPREGKTTIATNLAVTMAQSDQRVLLIDTDLRRPRIHKTFGISSKVGITSVLVGNASIADAAQKTKVANLSVIPCGPIPPNPSELLQSPQFKRFLFEARSRYDKIIFDSSPLGAVTDAAIIASQVDASVVVVKQNSTTTEAVRSVLRRLRDVGAPRVYGLLNGVEPNGRGYYGSGYNYYYSQAYYSSDEAAE